MHIPYNQVKKRNKIPQGRLILGIEPIVSILEPMPSLRLCIERRAVAGITADHCNLIIGRDKRCRGEFTF